MITLRHAQERGAANFGWLDSKHTFSFGSYYDPQHMGYSALRVINDDTVTAGAGFGTHGHRDMEIISYVTHGVIEHKDSMGNIQSLPKGEFQLMSAGKGVQHSEYNGAKDDLLTFLQIWIEPNSFGGEPGYQQKDFGDQHGLTPVITPTGENGTLQLKQDASVSQLQLGEGDELTVNIDSQRKHYVHVVSGTLSVNNHAMIKGDGAKIEQESVLSFLADSEVIAIVFDLPA